MSRRWDLVLWGATGFTGTLVAEYLARTAAPSLRIALAGRSLDRLKDVVSRLPPAASRFGLIEAGSASMDSLAASTAAVISTAGPFARCGEPLVAACCTHGTHYADITGETFWAARMLSRYGEAASASGAIVVSFSGFDSVPADLGVFYLACHVRHTHGARLRRVEGVMTGSGNVSGGTIASAFNMIRTPGAAAEGARPYLLFPEADAAAAGMPRERVIAPAADMPLLPVWVPSLRQWAGAFAMASINNRVVHRSAALWALRGGRVALRDHPAAPPPASGITAAASSASYSPPGEPFTYSERMGAGSWLSALFTGLALATLGALGRVPGFLSLLERFVPQPGQGPSPAARAAARFTYFLVAETAPAAGTPHGRCVVGAVSGGDGGYTDTAAMLSEAGMLLASAESRAALPAGGMGAGFLTPATAFGSILVDRLQERAGLRFSIVTDEGRGE